jgi:hypothetical protein
MAAVSQTFDVPAPEVDESQLVGVSVAIAEDSGEGEAVTAAEVDVELKVEENLGESVGEKRKRGRPSARIPPMKKVKEVEEEEDVCFICFDGGSLVLCDRRGCPKAYHPACIKRDEDFFTASARWNCGWHICSKCQKSAAHYMCYTCTYSLCKRCSKDADYVVVRDNKGLCTTCMKIIMLIENNDQGNKETIQVDFDDKTSWEYLFKVYWIYLKGKLSLTLEDISRAKKPWKGDETGDSKIRPAGQRHGRSHKNAPKPLKHLEENESNKITKTAESVVVQNKSPIKEKPAANKNTSLVGSKEWATKDLLEFVSHMKNGDTSFLSQFDVQALLLDYIKTNNLRDPQRKSQILCDSRLVNLFGKPRVGHFEMLKLLEFHFLIQEEKKKDVFVPAGVVDTSPIQFEADGSNGNNLLMTSKDKKRKARNKRGEERAPVLQTNLDEYAAIDVYNINLIYLRRSLMENLTEDGEKFNDKAIGSIVRIRICYNGQKPDLYRLVQVVGTSKSASPYKLGNKTAKVMLEVLNLDKKESVSIDAISNQDFSEEECRRLRQSIRCGLVKRLTVGEIQKKAMSLQAVRINDLLEAEILKLSHLRDRASEKGRKKDLRECVEKIQTLKTPEERQRRLREIPEVHSDPKMDPNYESEDNAGETNGSQKEEYIKPRYSKFNGKGNKLISPPQRDKAGLTKVGPTKAVEKVRVAKDSRVLSACSNTRGISVKIPSHHQSATVPTSSATVKSEVSVSHISTTDSNTEKLWHYRDPNDKIQGPFSMIQLQKWSTTGYFPSDMKIWQTNSQHSPLLLTDVLKAQLLKSLSPDNVDSSSSLASVNKSTDSPEQNGEVNIPVLPIPVTKQSEFIDLPSPTPNSEEHEVKEVVEVVEEKRSEPLDQGDEWGGYSPTPQPNLSSENDQVAPQGVCVWDSLIEFSTLPEESVSDLLAEVDAMESRGDYVNKDDCFSSIEEFSPTRDLIRSDAFSSNVACGGNFDESLFGRQAFGDGGSGGN